MTDRRTDGQTDTRQQQRPRLRIASRGKKTTNTQYAIRYSKVQLSTVVLHSLVFGFWLTRGKRQLRNTNMIIKSSTATKSLCYCISSCINFMSSIHSVYATQLITTVRTRFWNARTLQSTTTSSMDLLKRHTHCNQYTQVSFKILIRRCAG